MHLNAGFIFLCSLSWSKRVHFALFPKFLYRIQLGTRESKYALLFEATKSLSEVSGIFGGEWSEKQHSLLFT